MSKECLQQIYLTSSTDSSHSHRIVWLVRGLSPRMNTFSRLFGKLNGSCIIIVSISSCTCNCLSSQISPKGNRFHHLELLKNMRVLSFISAPAETVIVFLFRTFDNNPAEDGPVTYGVVFDHGILASLLLINGNFIKCISLV